MKFCLVAEHTRASDAGPAARDVLPAARFLRLASCVRAHHRRLSAGSFRATFRSQQPIRLTSAAHEQQGHIVTSPPATDLAADPNIGRVLAEHYRIDALLEQGGMGAVYRGTQLSVDRPVAVKLIAAAVERSAEHVARFRREAEAMARLRHPNTVRLFDFGVTEEGQLYMVMELLIGRDLASHLAQARRLSLPQALVIVRQIAQSLSEAHAQGIVHRDLKPGNIFLSRIAGGDSIVKVMDFGIAGINDDNARTHLTQSGAILGTAAYMSPEQAQGFAVDGRADLYSVGLLLFEMLAGRSPFEATSTVSLIVAQMTIAPPPIAEVCPELPEPELVQALLDRLLAKEATDRLGSAAELITLVDELLARLADASLIDVGPLGVPFASLDPTRSAQAARPTPQGAAHSVTRITSTGAGAVTRRRVGRSIGLALGALVVAACAWLWVRASGASDVATESRQVTIATIPAGASVLLAGAELGKTPYELRLKRPTEVEIALPPYEPQTVTVAPDGEPYLIIKLVPRPPLAGAAQ
jgi:serine/threonine-protein kinase